MKLLIISAIIALAAAPAATQTPANPPSEYGQPIALAEAMAIVDRGMKLGELQKHRMAFAVVEPSGELVSFARMDGVPYASIRLAQQKAKTAARLRIATAVLEERVLAGRTVLLSSDEVLAIGGGVPIIAGGQIVGALGVSGGTAAEDTAIANAALQAR